MTRVRVTLTTRGALVIVLLGVAFIFLWTVRSVLTPLVWAFIVAYILDPLVRWLAKSLCLPRVVVVFLLFGLIVGLLVWGVVILRPVLMRELRDLTNALPRITSDTQEFLLGSEPLTVAGMVIDPEALRTELTRALQQGMSGLGRQAIPFFFRAISSLVEVALFLISTFYLLLDLDKIGPAVVGFFPPSWQKEIVPLLRNMEHVLGTYIRGQVLLIAIMSVASWIVLTILQIRYSLLLAVMTGVVEIFPVIGPWTAGAIVSAVALTQPTTLFGGNSAMVAATVAASYFVLRQLEDIFVIPNVVGKVMQMHPLLVLFALTSGGYLAGILGVLIAVPIAAVVRVFLRFVRQKFMEEALPAAQSDQAPPAAPASA